MTLTRTLLIGVVIIGSAFAVLAFGNPQWKYCYMFQAYYWPAKMKDKDTPAIQVPPEDYVGTWTTWNADGYITNRYEIMANGDFIWRMYVYGEHSENVPMMGAYVLNDEKDIYHVTYYKGKPRLITSEDLRYAKELGTLDEVIYYYDASKGIDRRAEFGIPVE